MSWHCYGVVSEVSTSITVSEEDLQCAKDFSIFTQRLPDVTASTIEDILYPSKAETVRVEIQNILQQIQSGEQSKRSSAGHGAADTDDFFASLVTETVSEMQDDAMRMVEVFQSNTKEELRATDTPKVSNAVKKSQKDQTRSSSAPSFSTSLMSTAPDTTQVLAFATPETTGSPPTLFEHSPRRGAVCVESGSESKSEIDSDSGSESESG